MKKTLLILSAAALQAPVAIGQVGTDTYRDNAGPGAIYGPVRGVAGVSSASWIELDPATGNNGHVGVCVVNTASAPAENYEIVVSARSNSGAGTRHLVYRFDMLGNLVGTFNQDAAHTVSAWGMRDLVADPSGNGVFIGGSEAGFTCQDTTGALVGAFNGNPINPSGAGAQPVTGTAYAAAGNIYRAIAYDPVSNTFWTANFGGSLVNFDYDGNLITPPFSGVGWSAFGLAFDPGSRKLYCNAIPDEGNLGIIEPATGTIDPASIRNLKAGPQGGLSPAPNGDWYGQGWSSGFNVVTLSQSTPFDVVGIQRIDLLMDVSGTLTQRGIDDPILVSDVNGSGWSMAQKDYRAGDVLNLMITDPRGPNPLPAGIIFNFRGDDADAPSTFPGGFAIPESRALNSFSTPTSTGIVLSLGVDTPNGPITIPSPVFSGEGIRVQGVFIEPLSLTIPIGLQMTNEIHLVGQDAIAGVLCEAVGSDSFNRDPSQGFWRVTYSSTPAGQPAGDPIVAVKLDVAPIVNQVLDTDQPLMADRFDGGNSTMVGTCGGTYRNACDVGLGLDYSAGITSPCDPSASAGFSGTVLTGSNFLDLSFAFTGGAFVPHAQRFEFDCDTDGPGFSGAGQAGAVWTLTFLSGAVKSGTLAVDPNDPERSFVVIQ